MKNTNKNLEILTTHEQHRQLAHNTDSGETVIDVHPIEDGGSADELAKLGEDFRKSYESLQQNTNRLQAQFKQTTAEAIACGQILIKAKKLAGHGGWMKWFKENTKISIKSGERYMHLARNSSAMSELTEKSLTECYQVMGLIKKSENEEESGSAANTESTPNNEPSEFLQAKKLVLRLSELLNKTTDKNRMAEVIKPTIAWHNDFLDEQKKKDDAAKQDVEFSTTA